MAPFTALKFLPDSSELKKQFQMAGGNKKANRHFCPTNFLFKKHLHGMTPILLKKFLKNDKTGDILKLSVSLQQKIKE